MDMLRLSSTANKPMLYDRVESIRSLFNISYEDYPINFCEIISRENTFVEVVFKEFATLGAWGFIIKNASPYKSVLVLNKSLKANDINFALAHEIVHLFCHKEADLMRPNHLGQTRSPLEWQANEGAAELLLPYKFFIPDFAQSLNYYEDTNTAIKKSSSAYFLDERVIRYRYANLRKQFEQFNAGIDIDKLEI